MRLWSKLTLSILFSLGMIFLLLIYFEGQKISSEKISAWTEDHKADCAVVLTGSAGRVREGFDLLAQGQVKKLIISGVYSKATLREIFPQWPFYGDVNEQDVILEKRSLTTYGNAQQSLALVEALHCRDIVLVTTNIHMYRARKLFKTVFPEGFPIYTRAVYRSLKYSFVFDVFVESVKSIFYGLWAY